ncbi:MAG TPA: hypothetical protein PLV92_00220 [Pirellulaceae bacterium]|nr:hypothetical protein [Pirellulaceae bacterium]
MTLDPIQLTNLARSWLGEQSPVSDENVEMVLAAARDRSLACASPILESLLIEVISELAEQYRPKWSACVRTLHPTSNVEDVIHDFIVRVLGRIRTFATRIEASLNVAPTPSDASENTERALPPPPLHVWLTGQLIDTRLNNSERERARQRHVVELPDVGSNQADDGTGLSTRIDRNDRRVRVEAALARVGKEDSRAERILRAVYLEGMNRHDLAAELNVTVNHLDVLAHRARKLFEKAWRDLGFGPPAGGEA